MRQRLRGAKTSSRRALLCVLTAPAHLRPSCARAAWLARPHAARHGLLRATRRRDTRRGGRAAGLAFATSRARGRRRLTPASRCAAALCARRTCRRTRPPAAARGRAARTCSTGKRPSWVRRSRLTPAASSSCRFTFRRTTRSSRPRSTSTPRRVGGGWRVRSRHGSRVSRGHKPSCQACLCRTTAARARGTRRRCVCTAQPGAAAVVRQAPRPIRAPRGGTER